MTSPKIGLALAARREAALDRCVKNNGVARSRREIIASMVRDGATLGVAEGQRALIRPNGAYLLESSISKTALDYAAELLA